MCPLFAWLLPGHLELLIVALVALLLFGNRLPSVMRSVGRSIVEFKKGVQGIEEDIDEAVNETKKPIPSKEEDE